MRPPDVTVLMPVYNGERFVAETVESVLRQTHAGFEFIIVDDGSTDATRDIVGRFDDPRIRLVRLPRSGISAALNCGIRQARAPLIARIDADDLMEPQRLERQLAFVRARPEIGGAASYYRIIDERSALRGAFKVPLHDVADVERHLRLGGWLIYPHPTVIFRRDLALELGGYDHAFEVSEDVDFFLRMAEVGRPLLVQP
jgi:glycosyltransferase involved in cell wall biosynthesis